MVTCTFLLLCLDVLLSNEPDVLNNPVTHLLYENFSPGTCTSLRSVPARSAEGRNQFLFFTVCHPWPGGENSGLLSAAPNSHAGSGIFS